MASMAAWLLLMAADGTQRHQGQHSVCVPPKIPSLGERLHLLLPQQISTHVGEEAALSGGGKWFCVAGGDRTETAASFMLGRYTV